MGGVATVQVEKFQYYAGLLLLGAVLATTPSCSDDEGIVPAAITNLSADSAPGSITLHWDIPENSNIRYIEVDYYDPLLQKDVMRTASSYSNSMEIPDTRKKCGEYVFTVYSVSSTGDKSSPQVITQVSEAAPVTTVRTQVAITPNDLSTNAQEPTEGSIANLLDGNTSTYFHTTWSVTSEKPHWMQVNLKQEITGYYQFYYAPRTQNSNNKPTDFDLMGSTDGTNWLLIKNFTKEADGLPVTAVDDYTSEVFEATQPFSYIRIVVNATNSDTVFWTMSEFKFYTVSIEDPESPDAILFAG